MCKYSRQMTADILVYDINMRSYHGAKTQEATEESFRKAQ